MKDKSRKSRRKSLLYQRGRDTFELSPVSEVPRDEAEPITPEVIRHATWEQDLPSEAELGVRPRFAHDTPVKERTAKVTEPKLPTTSFSVKARQKSIKGFSSVLRRNVVGNLTAR